MKTVIVYKMLLENAILQDLRSIASVLVANPSLTPSWSTLADRSYIQKFSHPYYNTGSRRVQSLQLHVSTNRRPSERDNT